MALGACSTVTEDRTLNWPPERLYKEARDEMAVGNWQNAVKALERLESRYPFGRWAQQAQLDIAYSYYRENDRPMALASIDRFLKLYPNHPALDYAYYLRGLINFNEQRGLLARWGGQDLSERDLAAARDAFDAFREVVTRFPDSKYASDAEDRMRYLINAMASGEVHIARYYYRRGAFMAAANRAQGAIRQYKQAPVLEEALAILMHSYRQLGLDDQRRDVERVLAQTYPGSRFLSEDLRDPDDRRWWQVWR